MPKTIPPRRIVEALAYALTQVRPEAQEPGAGERRDVLQGRMDQWETDVMCVSLALVHLGAYDDTRFRAKCQGPKDRGENP